MKLPEPDSIALDTRVAEPNFGPLTLYTLGVVCEGTARLQLLLEKHDHLLKDNDRQVAQWITARLDQIQTELRARCLLLQSGSADNELLWSTFYLLLSQITALEESHSALKHLSVPRILRDTTVLLDWFWRALTPSGKLGAAPALALSDEVEPSEHSIGEDEDVSVVTIAKVDYATPTAWPLLVHELGHRLIPTLNLFGKNTDDVEKAWLIELGCDRLGVRLVGPAYVAAFASRAITKYGYFLGSTVHPPPYVRVEAILASIEGWMLATPLVKHLRKMHQLRIAAERKDRGGVLPSTITATCTACGNLSKEMPREQSPKLARQTQTFFARLDARLKLGGFQRTSYTVADDMTDRLKRGVLVSSNHQDVAGLRADLSSKRKFIKTRPTTVRKHLNTMISALCDSPHQAIEIITGAWIFNSAVTTQRLNETVLDRRRDFAEAWRTFREQVRAFDELILASIETAEFHRELSDIKDL